MIIGIGIDVVSVGRIVSLWRRHRARLCESVFTRGELCAGGLDLSVPDNLTLRQAAFLAERFAGKEAVIKVMALDHSAPFELNDIDIIGAHALDVRLAGTLKEIALSNGIGRMSGSCSSTKDTTVAFIIGESTHE